jgi:hypothetical protein
MRVPNKNLRWLNLKRRRLDGCLLSRLALFLRQTEANAGVSLLEIGPSRRFAAVIVARDGRPLNRDQAIEGTAVHATIVRR